VIGVQAKRIDDIGDTSVRLAISHSFSIASFQLQIHALSLPAFAYKLCLREGKQELEIAQTPSGGGHYGVCSVRVADLAGR
jgi:hypothetical protein